LFEFGDVDHAKSAALLRNAYFANAGADYRHRLPVVGIESLLHQIIWRPASRRAPAGKRFKSSRDAPRNRTGFRFSPYMRNYTPTYIFLTILFCEAASFSLSGFAPLTPPFASPRSPRLADGAHSLGTPRQFAVDLLDAKLPIEPGCQGRAHTALGNARLSTGYGRALDSPVQSEKRAFKRSTANCGGLSCSVIVIEQKASSANLQAGSKAENFVTLRRPTRCFARQRS
jgi:hypothetical protein